MSGKLFFQWTYPPDVLLAMKHLREIESVKRPSGETGRLIRGIWSPLDIEPHTGVAQ